MCPQTIAKFVQITSKTVAIGFMILITYNWLVVWNMTFIFPYLGNGIIPTDELIFFRGMGQPPTR
jgi:hypothetical protein